MKICFIDVDGVCNRMGLEASEWTKERSPGGTVGVDERNAILLRRLLKETDVKIVLCSTWRKFPDLVTHFLERIGEGISERYLGRTCTLPRGKNENERPFEIEAWLIQHPDVSKYAVIDDEHYDVPFKSVPSLKIDCYYATGVTESQMEDVIKFFNSTP